MTSRRFTNAGVIKTICAIALAVLCVAESVMIRNLRRENAAWREFSTPFHNGAMPLVIGADFRGSLKL